MNKRELFKKSVVWSLIAAMINPAMIAPAFARDSDIYLASTTGTSTAEPNVLFILGTNDRMNVAEAWREYDPVAYDSHAEYLWNDVNIISAAEVLTENQDKISDASPPTNPSSAWGTWSGTLNTDRKALWQATLAYANGTQGTDPGPRSTYRNYWDGSWHYWLPAGTATTDPRLWSVSFNRFRGFVQTIAGSRGGVTFPSSSTANYTAANDFRAYNLCTSSFTQIEPSTIFAPSGRAQNAGYMLNQQWIRYEPYLNLTAVNNPAANYPGSHATFVNSGTTYYTGFVNMSVPPTNTAGAGPDNGPTNVYRDSNGGNVGSVGQPIRIRKDKPDSTSGGGTASVVDAGDSYGGWTDPAADLGGFTFQSYVATSNVGYYYPQAVLTNLRTLAYGYPLKAFTGSTALLAEQFSAYVGNRDSAPVFHQQVGTPAYYDITSGNRGAAQTQCDPAAGPAVANQCIGQAAQNATWTRTCTQGGLPIKQEQDASGTTRFFGETCANNGAVVCASDPMGYNCGTGVGGPLGTRAVALVPPALNCALTNTQASFFTRAYNSTTVNTGSCAWSGQATVAVASCAWTGRSTVYIEGQGNYYYGGSCVENASAASCVLGGGTYVASKVLNGVAQSNVIGPFANPVTAAQQATGCANSGTFPAGNYSSGGTCTLAVNSEFLVPSPGPGAQTNTPGAVTAQRVAQAPVAGIAYPTITANAQCQTTAGTASISIRGAAGKTYNQTCSTLGNVDQTCAVRPGITPGPCLTDSTPNNHCPVNPGVSTTTPALPGAFFQTFQINATTANLYHECLADGPSLNLSNSYPTKEVRTFATAANTTAVANTNYGSNINRTALYSTNAGEKFVADPAKNIDVYSTNYLNFLYGAKACRNAAGALIIASPLNTPPAGATCSPIGRKTRLQVAKDALSGLVSSTDGVRLGLMVYNKTQGCNATDGIAGITQGDITAGSHSLINVAAPGTFVVGNSITVIGAGVGGVNLSTTITAIAANVYTLAGAAASTAVVGAQVQANGGTAFPNNNQITVVDPSQFIAGAAITVKGAGAAAADLVTTISAVAGNVYTLANPVVTGVNGAAVQLTTCTGGNVDDGGNIAYAVRRMGSTAADLPAYNNRQTLINTIQSVVASSRTPLTESLYEAYLYFSGRTPKWGLSNLPAGGGGTVSAQREATRGVNVDPPSVFGNVYVTNPSGKYNSPMLNNPQSSGADNPANCQKNYIVMITNGQPEEDSSANTDIKTMAFAAATGATVAPRTDFDTGGATPNNAGAPDYRQIPMVAGGSPYGPPDAGGTAADGGYVWLDELTYFISQADVSPGAANFQSEYSHCASPSGTHVCDTPMTTDLLTGRQSIISYTIGFAGISAPVVQNAAQVSGGVYYIAQNAQQLQAALVAAFVAIRNWNPTAAAATVPISSLNRGESSHDVYLAFFGPTVASVWPGTVKKYQISNKSSDCNTAAGSLDLCLTSQNILPSGSYNIEVPDPITGQSVVEPTATSGANDLNHPTGSAWYASTLQDGALPNRGGTGHVLVNTPGFTPATNPTTPVPNPNHRNIYTYLTNSVLHKDSLSPNNTLLTDPGNAVDFIHNSSQITPCRLGDLVACATPATPAMNSATQETLISYIRGGSLGDTNCTDGSALTDCTTWSTWPHAAVEHSKPVIVNYITAQYMYYVQNNGMLTAVDTHTGQEKWSFLIEEALPKLQSMQANLNGPEIYVADGSPVVFHDDLNGDGIVNGSDRLWLYFGLRRGGRVYYALDITIQDTPKFKWKISAELTPAKVCNGSSTCADAPQFNELGQTWSTPAVVKLKALVGVANNPPALIFGGGYDPAEDTVPPGARTMGRAVYILNGDDPTNNQTLAGQTIPSFGLGLPGTFRTGSTLTQYAVPSDITAINTDFDAPNYIDRLLFGDLGGNVWRIDVDDPDPTQWKGLLLASLSDPTPGTEKRKFFFPPAVAPFDTPFRFDAVYIGSGDKEHPLLTSSVVPKTAQDKMFMLMDDPSLNSSGGTPDVGGVSAHTTPITAPPTAGSLLLDIAARQGAGTTTTSADLIGKQGWFFTLEDGEKVINAATVFRIKVGDISRLRFGTYTPLRQLNACTPPGEGRLNEIDALNGNLLLPGLTTGSKQRWYSGFLSRGYMSSTQLIILPIGATGLRGIYQFNCADANCQGTLVATMGAPTKIYWYLEPEL